MTPAPDSERGVDFADENSPIKSSLGEEEVKHPSTPKKRSISEVEITEEDRAALEVPDLIFVDDDNDDDNGMSPLKHQEKNWIRDLGLPLWSLKNIKNDEMLYGTVINTAQKIMRDQYISVNGFYDTGLSPMWNKDSNRWMTAAMFGPSPGDIEIWNEKDMVNILHNGSSHWITTVRKTHSDYVYVLDSIAKPSKPFACVKPSINLMLSQLYRYVIPQTDLIVHVPLGQNQSNSLDCGVFAIANTVEFCETRFERNFIYSFDTSQMRSHLIQCMKNMNFTPFPKTTKRYLYLQSINVKLSCTVNVV